MSISIIMTIPQAIILATDSSGAMPAMDKSNSLRNGDVERIILIRDIAAVYTNDDVLGGRPTATVLREMISMYVDEPLNVCTEKVADMLKNQYPLTKLIVSLCSYRSKEAECYQIICTGDATTQKVQRLHMHENKPISALTWSGEGEAITRLLAPIEINGEKHMPKINFDAISINEGVDLADLFISMTIRLRRFFRENAPVKDEIQMLVMRPEGIEWQRGVFKENK